MVPRCIPGPLRRFSRAPHQVCQFHVLKEITKAVLHAVAKVRKELATPDGRPFRAAVPRQQGPAGSPAKPAAAAEDHRPVRPAPPVRSARPDPAERRTFQRITRGLPHLRSLRQIMDEVYRLFDRRCRTETALAKLARLRRRVRRFAGRPHAEQAVLAESGKGPDLPE